MGVWENKLVDPALRQAQGGVEDLESNRKERSRTTRGGGEGAADCRTV